MSIEIKTILLVEDSKSEQLIAKFAIKKYNKDIEVLTAFDGKEALDILGSLPIAPELILLDITMPGMDGFEFLENYEQFGNKTAVVVMLTSSDRLNEKERCLAYSCVKEFINKSLEVEDFVDIEKVL